MSTAVMNKPIVETSPQCTARIAGVFYALTVVTSLYSYYSHGHSRLAFVSGLAATACYIAVTLLFYFLFKPVSRNLSLLAALFSLAGSAVGVLHSFHLRLLNINSLVFFGFYCLLIGYLILKSTFLPKILGVLMGFAGVGWLTFLSPSFAKSLNPYNLIPGGVGEILLTLWLLVKGVDEQRWKEQASLIGRRG